jgi:hypothetical protein
MADKLKAGCIVKGHLWPEPVEIKLLEEAGECIHMVGLGGRNKELLPWLSVSLLRLLS